MFTGFYDKHGKPINYGAVVRIDFDHSPIAKLRGRRDYLTTVEKMQTMRNGFKCRYVQPDTSGYLYYDDMNDPICEDVEVVVA